jgi:hypothetical protein
MSPPFRFCYIDTPFFFCHGPTFCQTGAVHLPSEKSRVVQSDMPVTQSRREDKFIDIFLSAYENCTWRDAHLRRPERTQDNAVEAVATRTSDGRNLAIEHTIVEPFVGEKGDLAQFSPAFEKLLEDKSFLVPDRITNVFVPVGILDGQKADARQALVDGIAAWLKSNIATLPKDWSTPVCSINIPRKPPIDIVLNIEVLPTPDFSSFKIARQQISTDLNKVVEKMLRNKLPKLLKTEADRRILMLEREHMNLLPEQIISEIEKLRTTFPDLQLVDEIWMAETMFYVSQSVIYFFRYDAQAKATAGIGFWRDELIVNWDHTMPM